MNKSIERQIKLIYNKVYKSVFTSSTIDLLSKGDTDSVNLILGKLQSSDLYNKFAEKFSKELAKKGLANQRGIWRKYFEAAKKAHYVGLPITFSQYEKQIMRKAIENNFQMIKSIPDEMIKMLNHKYSNKLIEEVVQNKISRGSFRKQLEKHGVTNSKVIARTETAKLQTVILENRATDLGSIVYEWIASNDKRTRPSHRAMNGVIVFWKQPKPQLDGMIGHAGEFPNCRCSPNPIMDEDDLDESYYKVYNYKSNQVVRMTRNELLNAIKKGEL